MASTKPAELSAAMPRKALLFEYVPCVAVSLLLLSTSVGATIEQAALGAALFASSCQRSLLPSPRTRALNWISLSILASALLAIISMLVKHSTDTLEKRLATISACYLAILTLPFSRIVAYLESLGPSIVVLIIYSTRDKDALQILGLAVGRVDGWSLAWAVLCIVLSSIALVAWSCCWAHGQHGPIQDELGPALSPILVIPYALVNALSEEIEFRVLILSSLWAGSTNMFCWVLLAIVLHAVYFATLHVSGGFPSGACGGILVFIWAVFLGILRWWSEGMALVLVLHVQADIVIFTLVLIEKHFGPSKEAATHVGTHPASMPSEKA